MVAKKGLNHSTEFWTCTILVPRDRNVGLLTKGCWSYMAKQFSYLDLPPWSLPSIGPRNWLYMETQSFAIAGVFRVAGLVAKGSITQMEISNLCRELMALSPFEKPQSENPFQIFGYLPEADVKSAYFALNLFNLVIQNLNTNMHLLDI